MRSVEILKDAKILLIEDNQAVRHVLHTAITEQGCSTTAVATAEEGLRALEEQQFDVIISDFRLPGIDGIEFLRRTVVSQPNSVRVLISGLADENTVAEAYEIGVHLFIRKPFSLTTLFDKLLPHIEKQVDRKLRHDDAIDRKTDFKNKESPKRPGIAEDLSIFRTQETLDLNWY